MNTGQIIGVITSLLEDQTAYLPMEGYYACIKVTRISETVYAYQYLGRNMNSAEDRGTCADAVRYCDIMVKAVS